MEKTEAFKVIYRGIDDALKKAPDEGTGDYGLMEDIVYADMVSLKKSLKDLFYLMGEDVD